MFADSLKEKEETKKLLELTSAALTKAWKENSYLRKERDQLAKDKELNAQKLKDLQEKVERAEVEAKEAKESASKS